MTVETMMCPSLYNDMASVVFGLYESHNGRSPYDLLVINHFRDENKMLFFSSTEDIGVNNGTLSYKEWINCNKGIDLKIQELSEYQNFDFAPYVISLEYEELKSINEVFFKETLKIKHKGFLLSWPFYDKGIYFLLYRDEILLPNNNLPSQMTSVLEVVRMKWLEYFSHSFNTNLPRIDVSEIVESLVDFKDIAKYYPCTKM